LKEAFTYLNKKYSTNHLLVTLHLILVSKRRKLWVESCLKCRLQNLRNVFH